MRVVSVGECMMELAPAEAPGQFTSGFAGDTFNTAWYLNRLAPDWQVDFLTAVGSDPMSDSLVGFCEAAGIGAAHIRRVTDRTVGLYLISLQDGERSFSYWRGQSAARLLAEDRDALATAFTGADVIYLSGITLAILEGAGRDVLFDALSAARAAGSKVVFDPNLRPRLWPNVEEMCAAVAQAGEYSDIILPSFEDEATFFGDADPHATLERWRATGASTVIVKNGEGTMLFQDDTAHGQVSPVQVGAVVDTTAAGDSFNAGFMAAYFAGTPCADAMRAGATVAAQVIQGRGALVDI